MKEITPKSNKISILAPTSRRKEITPRQPLLDLGIERDTEVNGIGMGVLKDGTPYLNQRGLAALCGVMNAHIGSISSQWSEEVQKPRIKAIKDILAKSEADYPAATSRSFTPAKSTIAIHPTSALPSLSITPLTLAIIANLRRGTTSACSLARNSGT